jgi:hypothetical protein
MINFTFNRYSQFTKDGNLKTVPFISIPNKKTDIKIIFQKGEMRLDQLSYQYYNSSDYGWLIMQANPQYGSLEYNIPDNVELRIPYPLDITLNDYQKGIETYYKYNN